MKILKQGKLPGDKKANVECSNCHTEFEVKASEAMFHTDQRDGGFYKVRCPLDGCGSQCIIDTRCFK